MRHFNELEWIAEAQRGKIKQPVAASEAARDGTDTAHKRNNVFSSYPPPPKY